MNALVVGYGSIGKRHARILYEMSEISGVAILSSQSDLPYITLTSLEDITSYNPDYVVISSNTVSHISHLSFLEGNLEGKIFLVEKPLFETFHNLTINKNKVFVGYNLRFHPVLQKIKKTISDKKLWSIQVFCGSYLPDWRPGRDYQNTYSSKRKAGGGVLLDLSHEIDYVNWLAGPIKVDYAVSKKMSDLNIQTDDLLLLTGRSDNNAQVQISLNYFTRKPCRRILIDGEGISIQGDLIANSLSIFENNKLNEYSWPKLKRNDTYITMHQHIIKGDEKSDLCTYEEGLATMNLIDIIKTFSI